MVSTESAALSVNWSRSMMGWFKTGLGYSYGPPGRAAGMGAQMDDKCAPIKTD